MVHPNLSTTLAGEYYGIDSVEVYRLVTADTDVLELLSDIMHLTYRTFLGSKGNWFVDKYLRSIRSLEPGCTTAEIKRLMLDARLEFRRSHLNNYYHQVFRSTNLLTSVRLVGGHRFRGAVVDVGAADNALGLLLLSQYPCHVSQVIGVDIARSDVIQTGRGLQFRLQENPSTVPVANAEADTAVLRYVLHHMPDEEQICILNEAKRILKPGGIILVYENTYSFNRPPLEDRHSLNQRIIGLGSQERIHLLLASLDTFSQGIKEKLGPFPFTYHSFEEWLHLFACLELELVDVQYYGMPILDLHQSPLGVFVLRRR
jgi:SAM-dependent methyltransferase